MLRGINEEKLGGSDVRGGQPGLLVALRPWAVDRRQSQGRAVQRTHHRLHRAFLQCGVTSPDAAELTTVLFVVQKVLYLQIKTHHDLVTP